MQQLINYGKFRFKRGSDSQEVSLFVGNDSRIFGGYDVQFVLGGVKLALNVNLCLFTHILSFADGVVIHNF